ncbi:hypothetical protein DPMN_098945 [Dreissena polymorpha]|uniref:Uncharacterized protein n=1 Tax=Dreissena polymorpha TaxID=45954 RepID=A0A9D4LEK8_DREPO|nr:hypothetical protein DPMN_098945 [Dreissena polymorpha]
MNNIFIVSTCRNVRDFYEEMTSKMIGKFPLTDSILQSLSFLRPEKRETVSSETGEKLKNNNNVRV